jgi:hypothetical protein
VVGDSVIASVLKHTVQPVWLVAVVLAHSI